jgi:isoleucyl-tRNA synthetase
MTANNYPEVNPNPDFAAMEEKILVFWEKEQVFQRSVDNRPATKNGASNEFIFYDGPPFANGLPHYGHLLTGYVKDLFARYETMRGKRVERRFGWDCHGLPAEMGAEKELGISGRQAIINYGIAKFNEHCRTSVMKYAHEWEAYVTRQARWVDFKHDYKTMNITFMESVLWAFKQLYDKGLVYEAYRVMPYSWAAETPLSNFETKLDNSYREREDKAVTVAFELEKIPSVIKDFFPKLEKAYILAWTTTPWTLPSNLALAVNTEIAYNIIFKDNNCYILSANARNKAFVQKSKNDKDWNNYEFEYENAPNQKALGIVFSGSQLLGLSYQPLFPYFDDEIRKRQEAFRILDGSAFVTDTDGTGIVHMAPGFGEVDQKCCEDNGISVVVPVDGQGKYTDAICDIPWSDDGQNQIQRPDNILSLKGLNVIAETLAYDDGDKAVHISERDVKGDGKQFTGYGLANMRITRWLKANGKLFKDEKILHNYPHCWRTDQPLIYRAMPSWYVEVTRFRARAAELNRNINWIPDHVKDGQMGHMLATAPDWSISRNRFWGTPIPIWRSKSGKIKAFGSIAELEAASGQTITDLHRPYIDDIIIHENGEEFRRVEDVFDCWFESGSMPFAQVHYPFENKDWFEHHFPADFITEYVGQTRGWFNTLIMLATGIFDKEPFKNCICHGVVLDAETGLKYSKRLKNYKDPLEVINQFGADALRWLMIASPVMRGQDLMVDPQGKFIRDVVRLAIKPIWNAYNFFCLYANADGIKASFNTHSHDVMDRYILAKCKQSVETIQTALDRYDTPSATDAVSQFFEALNNWYIRRNKERFWKGEKDADKQAAYDTLYTVLTTMCKAAAPLLPLTCEEIYKTLTGEFSVHLADFPDVSAFPSDAELTRQMDFVRDVCNAALAIRNKNNIRVRLPLQSLTIVGKESFFLHKAQYEAIIRDEVNVKEIAYEPMRFEIARFKLKLDFKKLGLRLPDKVKSIIGAAKKPDKASWKMEHHYYYPVEDAPPNGEVLAPGTEITLPGWQYLAEKNELQIAPQGWVVQADEFPTPIGDLILLEDGEYEIKLDIREDLSASAQALACNDALVMLDIAMTPELEAEGTARDLVRMIQQARKDANLNVSDRIRLHIDAPAPIAAVLATHGDYIRDQTLTAEWLSDRQETPVYSIENALDEHKVVISISVL